MKQTILKFFSDKQNRNIIGVILGIIILSLVIIIPISLATPTPISSVEIKSENLDYDKKEPGSFKVTKSAKWISKGKAQITFDVDTIMENNNNYSDVILVLDTSDSMSGKKLEILKENCIELVDNLLADSNNKVALITFGTSSSIVSNFTNDKADLSSKINDLQISGSTNYYQALVNVDNILKDYQKQDDKEVITLFLTDGYPDTDTPNEESKFRYLKNKYSYLTINGIQYEVGNENIEVLEKISDEQFVATIENLNNILFEAALPTTYEKFNIIDYINDEYFTIKDKSDIKVSQGEFTLTDDNSKIDWTIDNLKSGIKVQMSINISLKDKFLDGDELYSTNVKEKIKATINDNEENITSTLTPVLANNYQVIYDGNAPDGCSVKNVLSSQRYSVFDVVNISNESPTCSGYKFKGWKIVTDNVKSINDQNFIMPEADVILRAEWSKVTVTKSMDGEVSKVENLYNMMARNSKLDTDIDFSSKNITAGIYELSSTKDDEFPVYYYRGAVTNNNVIFANFCWKMVRTTSTGGVKLIYNGVPSSDGKCNNTGTASQIGTSAFNSEYFSLTDVGYMYGTGHKIESNGISAYKGFVYGNDVTYENGVYTLTDTITSKYWKNDYKTIATKYHYTCLTKGNTCSSVYYILYFGNYSYANYLTLSGGKNIEDAKSEAFINTTNSTIKTTIDTWYENNMTEYTDYLEDTVWCNDRSIWSGPLKGKDEDSSSNTSTYFGAYERNEKLYEPSVTCPNANDSFTVNSNNGNGALTYPVALLTADEATLAGHGSRNYNSSSYLYTGEKWWSLSSADLDGIGSVYSVNSSLSNYYSVYSTLGVRPSVSLEPGTISFDGDGSANDPYIIK